MNTLSLATGDLVFKLGSYRWLNTPAQIDAGTLKKRQCEQPIGDNQEAERVFS